MPNIVSSPVVVCHCCCCGCIPLFLHPDWLIFCYVSLFVRSIPAVLEGGGERSYLSRSFNQSITGSNGSTFISS